MKNKELPYPPIYICPASHPTLCHMCVKVLSLKPPRYEAKGNYDESHAAKKLYLNCHRDLLYLLLYYFHIFLKCHRRLENAVTEMLL